MKSTVITLGIVGFFVGGLLGFLLRPSVFLVGQLPFGTVITRGYSLQGMDALLVPAAQTSFNIMLISAVIGTIIGSVIGRLIKSKKI